MTYEVVRALNGDLFAAGWRVEQVPECTCSYGGEWPHHPYCGLEPAAQCLPLIDPEVTR